MEEILKSLVSLVLVGFGWGLNEASSYFRTKRNDKRRINKVLFKLLEIRHNFVKLSNFDEHYKQIMTEVIKKYQNKNDPLLHSIIRTSRNILKSKLPFLDKLDSLVIRIEEDIEVVSEFDPINAYDLGSNYNLKEKLKSFNDYLDEAGEKLKVNEIHTIKDIFEPKFLEDSVENIEKSIREFSKKSSRSTKKRIKIILNKSNALDQKEIKKDIEFIMQAIKYITTSPEQNS